jgi:ankyrin repeat protein
MRNLFLRTLPWLCFLSLPQYPMAWAYYNPYGGYSYYGSRQQSPIISLDFNNKDIINSSFRIAAREDRLTDVQTYLLQGADINSHDDDGQTALMYSARNCTTHVALFLLNSHANPNIQDAKGRTALMYAAMESCLPIARLLVRRPGIALRLEDQRKRNAFAYATDAASLYVDGPSVEIKRLLSPLSR